MLVAARTPPRVPPLSEVRAQVEQAASQQQQNEARTTWLEGLREEIPVENPGPLSWLPKVRTRRAAALSPGALRTAKFKAVLKIVKLKTMLRTAKLKTVFRTVKLRTVKFKMVKLRRVIRTVQLRVVKVRTPVRF